MSGILRVDSPSTSGSPFDSEHECAKTTRSEHSHPGETASAWFIRLTYQSMSSSITSVCSKVIKGESFGSTVTPREISLTATTERSALYTSSGRLTVVLIDAVAP